LSCGFVLLEAAILAGLPLMKGVSFSGDIDGFSAVVGFYRYSFSDVVERNYCR
jgi:hypothetical protein